MKNKTKKHVKTYLTYYYIGFSIFFFLGFSLAFVTGSYILAVILLLASIGCFVLKLRIKPLPLEEKDNISLSNLRLQEMQKDRNSTIVVKTFGNTAEELNS